MFREMRRSNQLLSTDLATKILKSATTGILSVYGDDEYPYAVPVNYACEDNKIYFHCAKEGHKVDAIQSHDKVCFTVITKDLIVPEKFTTHFESVIVFGRASIVVNDNEKMKAMRLINQKYAPEYVEAGESAMQKSFQALAIVQIEIEHLTGKQAKALVQHP